MPVVGIHRETLPEQTYGQSFVNMFPGWGGAHATPTQRDRANQTIASLIDFIIPTATRDMPAEDISGQYSGEVFGLGAPLLAGVIGKGGKTAKKILDFTQGQAWKKPFKSGTTYKAYHGKPGGKPITDVYPGMHVGSPGAAIDRLSYKAGLPWRAKSKRVPAGYVTALEISPKKPLLKTSPHYEHIFRNITRRHFDDWRAKPLSMPRSLYRTDWKDLTPLNKSLIDEYIPEEYDFLDYFKGPYSRNLQFVRSLGYDTIPYINKWENPGSVSTIILNPKRASPKILDETYRFDMPFYKSTEPTLNLSKKQLKEWISQQKAGKGDLYDILIKNAPGQKLVIFNKYGIPEVASPFGPVKANKDYINQILTIKDLMQATK